MVRTEGISPTLSQQSDEASGRGRALTWGERAKFEHSCYGRPHINQLRVPVRTCIYIYIGRVLVPEFCLRGATSPRKIEYLK